MRICLDVLAELRDLLPRTPVMIRRKFMPAVHLEFNQPLTDEEKQELKQAIKKRFGRRYHVEIWDEELEELS
ncbi:MAG: hypothetical protein DRJ69_02685 [Thermoprotei archaeon]|nr:MAG: hypothetical protein DRJ69_02685 [Thermoprotei archaeon]